VHRSRLAAAALLALALLVAGCGDDGGGEDDVLQATEEDAEEAGVPGADDPAEEPAVEEPAADDPVLDGVTVTGAVGEAMQVEVETPLEVDETFRRIVEEGDGDPLEAGQSVTFQAVGVNGRDGNEFDNTYAEPSEEGTPSIVMDATQVVPGLVSGLLGAPVGSRVVIAVAPQDGFQAQGGIPGAGIEADDTLVYVLDVLSAETPAEPLDRAEGTEVEPEAGLPTVELGDDGAPTITLPDGDPPTELVVQPLIEGEGAEVEAGQQLTVHYTGIIWPGGEQFDSSWDRGEPATFPIGTGGVISGWDEGLVGQTIGSQILLVIPPEQGYGPDGNPQAGIEGTDTLVFVVDILATS